MPARGWDWDDLLAVAGTMLDKAFNPDKCGASLRYGDAGDGEMLRQLGGLVWDGEHRGVADGEMARVNGLIATACWGEDERDDAGGIQHRFTFEREVSIFDDVGGVEAWKELNEALKKTRLGGR